jgi:ribose transport system substrate-binding protein
MKRFVAILVALLVLSTQSAFSEERTLNIVFIPKAGDQDFWKFMRKGVDRAVAESGNVRLTWRGRRTTTIQIANRHCRGLHGF